MEKSRQGKNSLGAILPLKFYSLGVLLSFACIFLLGTVFAFNFSHIVNIDSEFNLKRILVVAFIWVCSLGLCIARNVEVLRLSFVTTSVCSIFFILAVSSALRSEHPFWGMVEIANTGLLVTAFCMFTISMRAINQNKLIFGVYAFFLFLSVLTFVKYILFLVFAYVDIQSFDIHGLISGYENIRFFNQLQVMVMPLLLQPFFCNELVKFKKHSFAILSLHWTVLLQTEARGVLVALITTLIIISYFVNRDVRKQLIIVVLKTVLIGFLLWLIFIIAIPYWLQIGSTFQVRTSSSGRLDLWHYVLTAIPEHLWLGFGPMSFAWAEGRPLPNAHPHNSVMQLLYEYGVIVCLVCTVWVVSRIYIKLIALSQIVNTSLIPITYAVLAGLIYSLFDGVIVMPFAQIMFVFLVAMQMSPIVKTYKIGCSIKTVWFLFSSFASYLILFTWSDDELLPAQFPRVWLHGLISY